MGVDDPKVWSGMFRGGLGSISTDLARELILDPRFCTRDAGMWIKSGKLDKSLFKDVAPFAEGSELLTILTEKSAFSDAQCLTHLLTPCARGSELEMARLLDVRGGLIKEVLEFIDKVFDANEGEYRGEVRKDLWVTACNLLGAVAACRHIFSEELMFEVVRLATNARVLTPYACGVSVLFMLLNNANSSFAVRDRILEVLNGVEFRYKRERPGTWGHLEKEELRTLSNYKFEPVRCDWEQALGEAALSVQASMQTLGLGRYPTLTGKIERAALADTVANQFAPEEVDVGQLRLNDRSLARVFGAEDVLREFDARLASVGVGSWRLVLQLCSDWEGSIRELVDTSLSLAEV